MSQINLIQSSESSNHQPESCCPITKSNILKISLVVFGLLLIAASVVSHFYQVNTIAVGTMGGVGGLLILGTAITSIVQCLCERHTEISREEAEMREREEKRALEQETLQEQNKWVHLAENNDINTIKDAIDHNTLAEPNRLLHAAASQGHSDLVSLLLANGAEVRLTAQYDHLGYSALHLATMCHDPQKGLDTMRVLLDHDPTCVSYKARYCNFTALHLAAMGALGEEEETQKQKIELLIQHGADVNATDSDLNTPLHKLAWGSGIIMEGSPYINLIEILVNAGADWNAKNRNGETPLQVAQKWHKDWCAMPEIQKRLSALH